MLTSKDTMQTMIYRINGEFKEQYGSWEKVIDEIISNAKTDIRKYEPQTLKENINTMSILISMVYQ